MRSRTLGFRLVFFSARIILGVPQEKAATPAQSLWKTWLEEDAVYIITETEKAAFDRLRTDGDREKFIEDFWHSRLSTVTQENEFKEEHYRRIAYADAHFASTIPGWKTDRGRLYIKYGPPDQIEVHGSSEDWTYRLLDGVGRNVMIKFVDQALSPESSAILTPPHIQCGIGNCPEPLPESMNEFTFLEQLVNWQKAPPTPKFKELVDMIGPEPKNSVLPMNVQASYTRVTNATLSVELKVTFDDDDLKYVSQGTVARANIILYGQISTLDGRIVDWFEGTLTSTKSAEARAQTMNGSQRYTKRLLVSQGIYRLKVVAKDTNANTSAVRKWPLILHATNRPQRLQ